MTTVLVLAPGAAEEQRLRAELVGAGLSVLAATVGHRLVRDAIAHAPDLVVASIDAVDDALFDALRLLRETSPRAVIVLSADRRPEVLDQAVALEIDLWLPRSAVAGDETSGADWTALVRLAQGRHQRLQASQAELARLRAQLDERKWVDRAKGLLMRDHALTEEQAFQLLRTASMHANLRVGEVSRGVFEAAQAAVAINRAGQLRMLSQRLVRARAQVALEIDVELSRQQLADSRARVESSLTHLRAIPLGETLGALRDEAWQAWQQWLPRLDDPVQSLAALDACAQRLLELADQLTLSLEAASGRQRLHVVNLCGRQRMLSQRLAKQALLLAAGAGVDEAAIAATTAEFEAALAELERDASTGASQRAILAEARGQWVRLCEGVRQIATRAGRLAVARASESLLASFDELTERYERSTQVLMA